MDAHWFDLPREAKALVTCLRTLTGEGSLLSPAPATDEVATLLRIERGLHGADMSSLVRRHPIYRVRDDGTSLEPVMLEQTVDLAALERLFQVTIVGVPWMHARVTEVLDQRMLRHLLHEDASPRLPIAVKLHAGTVRNGTFAALLDELPAHWHARLAIELPYAEWLVAPDAVGEALRIGRLRQCLMVLDHVPLDRATELSLPKDVLLRLMPSLPNGPDGPATPLRAHDVPTAAALRHALRVLGAERCILTHCDSLAVVHSALDAGVRMLQGQAVADFAEMRAQVTSTATPEIPAGTPEDGTAEDEAVTAESETPSSGLSPWGRMLGWLHLTRGGADGRPDQGTRGDGPTRM
ncbi:hypothetical protein UCD39_24255 [Nitrospirillum sp. BR 11752]|uniref:hypothetical protein n=1 Tax=Nitrospirillum sp. BR 11752 TaxID=3104293 RepID=UPI002E982774|nr:hypothetical protein [Nitrospirillum sp. BR 11752]